MQLTSIVTAALMATSALAAPARSGSGLEEQMARRQASDRRTNPPQFVDAPFNAAANSSNVEYTDNWAGAVVTAPPAGSTFTAVSAKFVVPEPKLPAGANKGKQYAAGAWVGIDGNTYQKAILQTGVDFSIEDGKVTYTPWYEWFPASSVPFSGMAIKAGDAIHLSVESHSDTSGTATIINESTGKTVTKTLSSSAKLGGRNAEWIVEDYMVNNKLVPFADFGTVTFTDASFKTSKGKTGGPDSASIFEIQQGNTGLTSASESKDGVTVHYS